MLGLAIDIGTTNIAASLVDIGNKKVLLTRFLPNSQKKFGQDVITRLNIASIRGQNVMNDLLIEDINQIISDINISSKAKGKQLKLIYVAGNTVMLHFLFGIDATGLMKAPFRSAISGLRSSDASSLGIRIRGNIKVEALPVVSRFIGADLVAGLFGSCPIGTKNMVFIDLGTNAEISVISKRSITAASAAAGPAFKSSKIPFGSELIKKVSRSLSNGSIDRSGKIIRKCGIGQEDVRALQVAKAAIHSAVEVLLKRSNIIHESVNEVRIAGIFGEKLNIDDIKNIRLLPELVNARFILEGDAVLKGLERMIMERKRPKDLLYISKKVHAIELNEDKAFQRMFIKAMKF